MATPDTLLVLDCGLSSFARLVVRARGVGLHAQPAKTPDDARELLRARRHAIGAAVIPPDLPAADLGAALDELRELAAWQLGILVAGPRPDASRCDRLRRAGVDLALFEPYDDHTLRFQLNRALAEGRDLRRPRGALRAPADWDVVVRTGQREKPARVYTVSSAGGYVATPRPSQRGALVFLTLPLPEGAVRVTGRVVMTNVPGNLQHENLPLGMGVQWTGTAPEVASAIQSFAERREAALRL